MLAWFLNHAVTIGKQPMDIFIDEDWRLLRSGPFMDLLNKLGRRARKRGVGVTLITDLPANLMKNPTSLSLASTAIIGRLRPDEAFSFYRSLGVPESEARKNAETTSRLPPRLSRRTFRRTRCVVPDAGFHSPGLDSILETTGRM